MKIPHLRSVTVELVLLFVGALTIAEALGLGWRYADRSAALKALEIVRIADNIAVVVSLANETLPGSRTKLLDNLEGSNLYVVWSQEPWPKINSTESEAGALRRLLSRVLTGSKSEDIAVQYLHNDRFMPPGGKQVASLWRKAGTFPEPLRQTIEQLALEPSFLVSIRLQDGTWLNLIAAYVSTVDFWPLPSMVALALITVAIAVASIYAIARLTAPYKYLAAAAQRLGTDVHAAPLPERGANDVVAAIKAFNEMQSRLERLVEDRTQMLAAVSHDLRTPITRLKLRAESISSPALRLKFLSGLDEMERMVSDLLCFAKEDAHSESTSRVDLTAMLLSICDDLSDQGYLVSCCVGERVPFYCRPVALRRCLGNIIHNAAKYGVRANVSLHAEQQEVRIQIDDSGTGIPLDMREDVFRPFFRLDQSRCRDTGGAGLGLTIARSIARAHGGDIILENAPSGGLRVTILLPNINGFSNVSGEAGLSDVREASAQRNESGRESDCDQRPKTTAVET